MRLSVFAVFILFVALLSCNTSPDSNKLINQDNLPTQEYTIDINKDTVLVTKNGALLKIPKGSLVTDKGNTVTLEIKEAYSIQQMIEGGLMTQSNGEPLSSGGMIYINAVGGRDVKITQAIKVALPTDYLADSMQLFKGEKDENGNINWTEPTALPENKQLSNVQQGQVLFQSKCANCHAIGKDMTGPNLAHLIKRFGELGERTYQYYEHGFYPYRESQRKIDSVNAGHFDLDFRVYDHYDPIYPYKCNLIRMYGSTGPVLFNDTGVNDLDDVYRYIQNESNRNNLPFPAHHYLFDCADSCSKYKQALADLNSRKEELENKNTKLKADNGEMVIENRQPITPPVIIPEPIGPPEPVDFEEIVSPKNYGAEYYQFTIESFGWYNIDIFLKGKNGVEESELFVRITGEYRERVKVYLIIPAEKVYVEGGPAERNAEEFAFYLKNGKISLPQNKEAYILALTEREESIAFALKKFTTTINQEFDISLTASSKEAFTQAISQLNFDDLGIKVADTKNADEIRKTNKEIKKIDQELKSAEHLKPKNCACDCDTRPITSAIIETDTSSADFQSSRGPKN